MLAVFCLRLALGMLFSLFFLSPSKMHPRFFRTHFVTALGLSVVALIVGWWHGPTPTYVVTLPPKDAYMRAIPPEPSSEQRIALVTAVVLTFLGSLTWNLERPVGGRVLQVLTLVAMTAGLYYLQFIPPAAEGLAPDGSWQYLRPVRIPWQARFANDLTSAGLLGFAMTAMLVGHSYLISPGLSIRPLIGQIVGLGIVLLARADVAAWALWIWAGEHDITSLNDINLVWPVRWLVGLVGPLIFGWMAYRTAKIRSTQSATGILFVVVILTFLGELFGLLLSRITGLPL